MKNGKLFGKLSVIDLLVIALVILLLVAGAVRLGFFSTPDKAIEGTQKTEYTKVEREVTVSFAGISDIMLSDPVAVGDMMLVSGKPFGRVISVEKEPNTAAHTLSDGSVVTVEKPNAYNYIVKVKATLWEKNGFLRTEKNNVVAVGKTLTFITEYFMGNAMVRDIQ